MKRTMKLLLAAWLLASLLCGVALAETGLSSNFQSGAANAGVRPGQVFDCFPDLLNLTHAEFCLVQEDKMLVQIFVVKQHIAFCL